MREPNDFLREAVEQQDIGKIRGALVGVLQSDPALQSDDLKDALDYVKREGIDVFETEDNPQLPINKETSAWDQKYFATAMTYLRHNFTRERLEHVKEVSKATHQDMISKQQTEASDISTAQTNLSTGGTDPKKATGRRKLIPLIAIILGFLAAVIAILILKQQ